MRIGVWLVPGLGLEKEVGVSEVHQALLEGTKKGLEHHDRFYGEVTLDDINEKSIGEFFITFMMQISVLANILEVNAYDQPGVEEGKVQAKALL